MVALVAVAAFAGLRRATTALIDYPTSQAGITLVSINGSGETTSDVSYSTINIKGAAVDCIKFGKSLKMEEVEKYYAELSVEGGFKAGDKISIVGAYKNAATKNAAIAFYDASKKSVWTTENFLNTNDGTTEPTEQTFTLTADTEKLYMGRSGNTGTFIVSLTVTREAEEGGEGEPAAQEVTMQYSGSTTTNLTGENDAALVGLDATEWSVVGAKGSSNNLPGLNKEGTIRLYGHADGGNTITVSSLNNATINSITLDLKASNNNIYVKVGDNTIT